RGADAGAAPRPPPADPSVALPPQPHGLGARQLRHAPQEAGDEPELVVRVALEDLAQALHEPLEVGLEVAQALGPGVHVDAAPVAGGPRRRRASSGFTAVELSPRRSAMTLCRRTSAVLLSGPASRAS